jgi:hypothetical protein
VILATAEPFGFGPSSSLVQFLVRAPQVAPRVRYLGTAHTLDLMRGVPGLEDRSEDCDLGTPEGRARFREALEDAEALISSCDAPAAALAVEAGVPVALYDPLAWYWPELSPVAPRVDLYLAQEFFGVRERLARADVPGRMVVPPLTPGVAPETTRTGSLVSLGGLRNPAFDAETCAVYAAHVLGAAWKVLDRWGPTTWLTSKEVAARVPGLEVGTYTPAQVHERMAVAGVALMTPGLGQIYEASALLLPTVWLPPANDSQGRQLRALQARGLAAGAVDWHEVVGGDPVDYDAPQPAVLAEIAGRMAELAASVEAQDRLAELLGAAVERTKTHRDPLPGLTERFGAGGATVVGRALDRWAARGFPRFAAESVLPVPEPVGPPEVVALRVPPGNLAGPEAVEALRALHEEVDGTGFHTLAAALDLVAAARARVGGPASAEDYVAAVDAWDRSGLEVFARWGAGHCTVLAERLRARAMVELGLGGWVMAVRHADSKVALDVAWEDYTGTVHADVAFPLRDPTTGVLRVVHVCTGMGVEGQFHVVEGEEAWAARLEELAYRPGEVVDAVALTRRAFAYKDKLWVVPGPDVGEGAARFGVDVVTGDFFLNGLAGRAYRGARRGAARLEDPVVFPAYWAGSDDPWDGDRPSMTCHVALRSFLREVERQFDQAPGFTEACMALAEDLPAYAAGVLCQPGRRWAEAGRRPT